VFLNLLSLYPHFQILNTLDGKYSVRDIFLIPFRIKMYLMEKSEIMSGIPKKSKEPVEKFGQISSCYVKIDTLKGTLH
jgi:hypothetical protein